MTKTFICALCGLEFELGWSDEEAIKEMQENFGLLPVEERAIVCDDCFKKIMGKFESKVQFGDDLE